MARAMKVFVIESPIIDSSIKGSKYKRRLEAHKVFLRLNC
jgi:hypothetical protein